MNASDISTSRDVERVTYVLRGEMAELRSEFRAAVVDLRADVTTSTRHTIVAILTAAVTVWLTFCVPTVI